jgi:hypothetical protein
MQITKVKEYGDGYLVNGIHSVPNAPSNSHYQMIQAWLEIEGNNIEPEFTPEELVVKQAKDERAAKEKLAEKMQKAGKAIIKEFHILNQGDDITLEVAQKNAEVFASLKLYLDAGSEHARTLIEVADLTGTSLTEDDRTTLLNVWDSAIA